MRVFVYEYLCGGAAGPMPSSLRAEGWAMLSAVMEDFQRCPGVEVVTLMDATAKTEERAFRARAGAADFSLVIAPECDAILEHRCRWIEEEGGRLLGPSSHAVHDTADKLTLARHWQTHGIPTPSIPSSYPLVCKPRFGAGSQATFLMHNEDEWNRARQQAYDEGWSGELLLQAYVSGLTVGVSFLVGDGERRSLPAVAQRLSNDGRFRYQGGRLPLSSSLDRRARALAERAAYCVDGLHGWFGIDLVLGAAGDGSGDAVLEINPRLTTSYVGLRRLARFNLAEALLAVVACGSPIYENWHTNPIVFDVDGSFPHPLQTTL